MRKTFIETHLSCSMQKKRLQKTANIGKIESILKMTKNGHNTKAIAHAKYSLWIKK